MILTSTEANAQFKLKPKEKLDTNYEWKICTTFIGKYKINSWEKNYPYTNHMYVVLPLTRNNSNNGSQVSIMLR